MELRVNFQDLVSYLMPGAVAVLSLYWFTTEFFGLRYGVEVADFGAAVVFVIVCYVFGHVVQALGNWIEPLYEHRWGGKYSDLLLRKGNQHFTEEFKQRLLNYIQSIFGITITLTDDPGVTAAQAPSREEAFHECYSLILQEHAAQHAEIFQGLYGLYRGLLSAGLITAILSGALLIKQALPLISNSYRLSLLGALDYSFDRMQFATAAIALAFVLLTRPLLYRRLKRFAEHYANAVYQSFYAWCAKRQS